MARVTGTARQAMRADVGTVRKRTILSESARVDLTAAASFARTSFESEGRATVPTAMPKSPSGRCMIRKA